MASAAGSGSASPAAAKTYQDLLGLSEVITASGTTVPVASFSHKVLGLYFSAHWCKPCQTFTPVLADFYTAQAAHGNLEIVYVSLDRNPGQFGSYFSKMPWTAVPWEEAEVREGLQARLQVPSIPYLVFLSPDGTILTTNGRRAVEERPDEFPWR
jgi:nucleoredoxin